MRDMTYELVPTDSLMPHPRNPNRGDVGAIAESIRANGWYGAIVAQRSTRRILAGNHRWEAARQLGMPTVPVIWLDVDDERALRILLVDNRTTRLGMDDETVLRELLTELAGTSEGLDGTGWTGDDLDELISSLDDAAGPMEVTDGHVVIVEVDSREAQAALAAELVAKGYRVRTP
jgi:ParB-like chromosome segregation protein Spo0J